MIHTVLLADSIHDHLSLVVALQLSTLGFAASNATFDESTCATYLNRDRRFSGRGSAIAKWLTNSEKRWGNLKLFNEGPYEHKRHLVKRIRFEVRRLFRNRTGQLTRWPSQVEPWLEGGARFLRQFYEDFRSESGLPECIFGAGQKYDGQRFLADFFGLNTSLSICPGCDEITPVTRTSKGIRCSIDHYLPKASYPQLSCHPYNLIPVCAYCNSFVKLEKDPLGCTQGPITLRDIFMPYREPGIAHRTIFRHEMKGAAPSSYVAALVPRHGIQLQQRLAALAFTFQIPDRWSQSMESIDESLFLKIKERVENYPLPADLEERKRELARRLDWLLWDLAKRAYGRDRHAVVMTWNLARILDKELDPIVEGLISTSGFWLTLNSMANRAEGVASTMYSASRPRGVRKLKQMSRLLSGTA